MSFRQPRLKAVLLKAFFLAAGGQNCPVAALSFSFFLIYLLLYYIIYYIGFFFFLADTCGGLFFFGPSADRVNSPVRYGYML